MPSITRRRLLGGGAVVAAATVGASRLYRGATDATFASWTPAPGTWPLRRYDPANTAHNPHASPPRETPTLRDVASVTTAAERPSFRPVVGPAHVAVYGTGFAAYPRGAGESGVDVDAVTPLAGFGPDGRLHAVRRDPTGVDAPSAVVVASGDLRDPRRFPLDADHPQSLTVGSREVYVGTVGNGVRAVDPDGGRRWHVDGTMAALDDGRLYAPGALDGTVGYAQRTGIDRRLRAGPERAWRTDAIRGFPHLPAVADGRLVLGSYAEGGGAVVAVDAGSGDRLWDPRPLGRNVATPAVAGDRGYTAVETGAGDGLVVALDLATGETRWRDAVEWTAFAPAVGGDTLVVAGEVRANGRRNTGVVRAYDTATGDALWTRPVEAGVPTGFALVEDRILVTVESSLYELA
ncbi:PQQ-binding-like beta-propeller repeat protein [Haloplanus sp. GCM10025708]|uniref:outer membrane protein assembly factor BamB family protein n=1 Tax=Haloferacaceae TaxID=1644056 RepID=UPI00360D66AC